MFVGVDETVSPNLKGVFAGLVVSLGFFAPNRPAKGLGGAASSGCEFETSCLAFMLPMDCGVATPAKAGLIVFSFETGGKENRDFGGAVTDSGSLVGAVDIEEAD